ncbi:MAG: AbrB/MazE/SpoVT family DNA-binding domain-containing protein [Acidobacteriota bacterium]
MRTITQLTSRGQITLPAEIRKAAGLRAGDTLVVRIEGGRVILDPAVLVPVELYSGERIREFARAAEMTENELAEARERWRS